MTAEVPGSVSVIKTGHLPAKVGIDLVNSMFSAFGHGSKEAVEGASMHLVVMCQSSDEYILLAWRSQYFFQHLIQGSRILVGPDASMTINFDVGVLYEPFS